MVVLCILKDGTTVTVITHTAASGGLGLLQAGHPPGWRVRRAREAASGATCGRIRETQSLCSAWAEHVQCDLRVQQLFSWQRTVFDWNQLSFLWSRSL